MPKEKALEKPTNNELREQINSDWKGADILWYVGLILGILIAIFVSPTLGLIVAYVLSIMSNQHGLSQKLDKIRLEIRENNH